MLNSQSLPNSHSSSANSSSSSGIALPGAELPVRQQRIAVSAYLRAAQRGFDPGHELEDWLAAEREIDASHGAPTRPL